MNMVKERVHFNTARLKKGGDTFEVAIDPDLAIAFKSKKPVDIKDILKSEHIFYDVKKGLIASEDQMNAIFETRDVLKIAEFILLHGELQLTNDYRHKLYEDKKKKIIDIITRNGVDPKTHLPHPKTRIENAISEAKVTFDYYKSAEDQIQDVLKLLMKVLPIRFETVKVEVKIGSKYASKMYGVVSSFGKIIHDAWLPDGTWLVVIELPAGMQNDFYEKLNALTHGDVSTNIVK
jgi:ribosome maturation protein SDO1